MVNNAYATAKHAGYFGKWAPGIDPPFPYFDIHSWVQYWLGHALWQDLTFS